MAYFSLTNELFLDYQRMIDPFGAVIFWFILDFMLAGLSENLSVAARMLPSKIIERYVEAGQADPDMSLVMKKPVFGVCVQVGFKPACSATKLAGGLKFRI